MIGFGSTAPTTAGTWSGWLPDLWVVVDAVLGLWPGGGVLVAARLGRLVSGGSSRAATLQAGGCMGHPEAECADGSGVLVKAGKMP
ncbi:hypothetical protein ATK30_4667 [Amycolatopsis echigonensis]|uniref:Uncharacterized protein n=1 Tax=Amycolatopsis echigonensis TaxID=2576905 RepID=A0A2N3WIW9_9PSEU|nr:hypothetical protein ATK30_4667 [Amycolatopsis niigatensis]